MIKIALDFLLDKHLKGKNRKPEELTLRFLYAGGSRLFCRQKKGDGKPADGLEVWDQQRFAEAHDCLRDLVRDLSEPHCKHAHVVRGRAMNKHFKSQNLNTFDDFLFLYGNRALYGKNMHAFVFDLTQQTMGPEVFRAIEYDIMSITGMAYENQFVANEDPPKSTRVSGTIRNIVTRTNQTVVMDRYASTGIRVHHERIYGKAPRNGKKFNTKGVLKIVKATKKEWGFDGFVGFCCGHLMLLNTTEQVKPNSEANDGQILVDLINSASDTVTTSKLRQEWEKKKAEKRRNNAGDAQTPFKINTAKGDSSVALVHCHGSFFLCMAFD